MNHLITNTPYRSGKLLVSIYTIFFFCLVSTSSFAANVSDNIKLLKSSVAYDAQTQTGTIEVKLQNTGTKDLVYPVKVAVTEVFYSLDNADFDGDGDVDGKDMTCFIRLSGTPDSISLSDFTDLFGRTDLASATVTDASKFRIANSAGSTPEELPYLIYTAQESGQVLSPGQETDPVVWQVYIPVNAFLEDRTFHFRVKAFSGEDSTPPDLSIIQPARDSELKENQPAIMVNFQDEDSGIDTSSLTVKINGSDISTSGFTVTAAGATGQVPDDLPYNENTITVSIADNAGNVKETQTSFTVQPDKDTDNDGIPDWWELKHFSDLNAASDSDGDGVSNYDEYTAGTDPNNSDIQAPVILHRYPPDDTTLVATQGNPFEMIVTFGDNDSGIASVVLLDENGVDITSQTIISGNAITFPLKNPENREYQFQLILTDKAGNKTILDISFTADSILPVVTPSIPGGHYDAPFTTNLDCSENADIYYSTDGYPPFAGAANTTTQSAPVTGINIDKTTHIQFFAVDGAGNTGPTGSTIYHLDSTIPVTQVQALQGENDYVTLSWTPVTQAANYHIYRVANPVDKQILEDCVANGIAPPVRLRLLAGVTGETAIDNQVVPGTTYYYGITINALEALEGPLSELASIEFSGSSTAGNKDEAVQRAETWLKANQGTLGSWGSEKNKLLVTSQVLNAFKALEEDDAAVRKGVFFLRGNYADNNDFLGRQINTLYDFEQNVDYLVTKLISQAYISGTTIYGWGTRPGYHPDPVSTAVGASTVSKTTKGTSLTNSSIDALKNNRDSLFFSSDDYCFGWVADADASVYASSLIYSLLAEKYPPQNYVSLWQNFSISWVLSSQTNNGDGSFGNGLVDTAAVLLWLDISGIGISETNKTDAVNYLISQQNSNGSWANDPYVTGLCLQALTAMD
nr:chitobiase/beta-hexosaminidase C-terminal domain-containing protein [uncultured Desulfobacter sp.]